MGGSGNGGPPVGRVDSDVTDSCELEFEANVFGPVAGVADELSEGDMLAVSLTEDDTVKVVLQDSQGRTAGTLAGSARISKLVSCVQQGTEYSAEVISVDSGDIRVLVRNK